MQTMSNFKGVLLAGSLFALIVSTNSGCTKSHAHWAFLRVTGHLVDRNCGMCRDEGCVCFPDPYMSGYRQTMWAPLDPEEIDAYVLEEVPTDPQGQELIPSPSDRKSEEMDPYYLDPAPSMPEDSTMPRATPDPPPSLFPTEEVKPEQDAPPELPMQTPASPAPEKEPMPRSTDIDTDLFGEPLPPNTKPADSDTEDSSPVEKDDVPPLFPKNERLPNRQHSYSNAGLQENVLKFGTEIAAGQTEASRRVTQVQATESIEAELPVAEELREQDERNPVRMPVPGEQPVLRVIRLNFSE